jgi:hypothetical protein
MKHGSKDSGPLEHTGTARKNIHQYNTYMRYAACNGSHVKRKAIPVRAMKEYGELQSISIGTMWEDSGQRHAPASQSRGKPPTLHTTSLPNEWAAVYAQRPVERLPILESSTV